MRFFCILSVLLFLFWGGGISCAQNPSVTDSVSDKILLERQWSLGGTLHSNGWGLNFRKGYNKNFRLQNLWEIEFGTYKSSKEIRSINPNIPDSRSFFFGKLNYLWFLRGGIGQQRILNEKPYWGGVQLSWIYYGGFSLGITKPVYLYIIRRNTGLNNYDLVEERYDPEAHEIYDIYGRGPFLSGFSNLGFHPGAYLKSGLEFEFGARDEAITSLEAGAQFDYSPVPVSIMAFNPDQSLFLTLYISLRFGKRNNKR